jgi:hypothetical protein
LSVTWRQVGGFLRVLRFPPPINTDRHDITEILLKVALNTMTRNPYIVCRCYIYIQMYMYKFKHLSFLDIALFIGINIVLPTARSWRYHKCYSCNKIFIIFWGHFQVPDLSTVRSVTKHSNINIIWPSTDVYTAVRNLSSVRSVASVLVTLVPTVSIWIIATSTASQLVRSSTVLSSQIWLS